MRRISELKMVFNNLIHATGLLFKVVVPIFIFSLPYESAHLITSSLALKKKVANLIGTKNGMPLILTNLNMIGLTT